MRPIPAILALFTIVIISSCSKKYSSTSDLVMTDPNTMGPVVINGTVSANKSFTFTLGNSGTATITKQAAHYQVSAATLDGNGLMVYTYTPAADYSGTDEVAITYAATESSTGSGCSGGSSSGSVPPANYVIKLSVGGN